MQFDKSWLMLFSYLQRSLKSNLFTIFLVVIIANLAQLVPHLSWFFPSFFQCSLIHHTVFLPADISQKPIFMLDSALPLWPESVQRCSSVVQQCCHHSISPLIFCCALYWFNLSLRKAREGVLLVMLSELIFFYYSPNRIRDKLHSLSKKGRKMYFLDCRVKIFSKFLQFQVPGM